MNRTKMMYLVSLMFDLEAKLESVTAATRISKSGLLRISYDEFRSALGSDPETPALNALRRMLRRKDN